MVRVRRRRPARDAYLVAAGTAALAATVIASSVGVGLLVGPGADEAVALVAMAVAVVSATVTLVVVVVARRR